MLAKFSSDKFERIVLFIVVVQDVGKSPLDTEGYSFLCRGKIGLHFATNNQIEAVQHTFTFIRIVTFTVLRVL